MKTLKKKEDKKYLLYLAKCLIKESKDIASFERFAELLKGQGKLALIKSYFKNPPFPRIDELESWLKDEGAFKDKYDAFIQKPFGERRLENAFTLPDYERQKANFADNIFNDEKLGSSLNEELEQNRKLSVNELVDSYNALKGRVLSDQKGKLKLLCICIEMLARTTSQKSDGTLISQELNATQVMALYAMIMRNDPKLITQIDTGEGKSRISMILAAYQAAQGMTVDVMTSDISLAERDYLAYNDFFSALGIRTSLITLDTPKQLYQKGGVNFTDVNQLVLLRNKSDIDSSPFDYLTEEADKRCLLIDEEDKFRHDKSKDAHNYAAQSKSLVHFVWIYPLLVKYVRENVPGDKNFVAKDHIDRFLSFVSQRVFDNTRVALLANLRQKNEGQQITTWLDSAWTAVHVMKKDTHYKLTESAPDELIAVRDAEGITRFSRKVLVLDNGRPAEGSIFSAGLHQCLCAKENIDSESGKEEFVIPPENETLRASYPVASMSQYGKGKLFGISGTTRSDIPKQEPNANYEGYAFINVPRHKKLIREDKHIFAAKDEKQQFEFVKRALLEKLGQNQAVLIICRDDDQSQKFYRMIEKDEDLKNARKALTRIHALSSKKEESEAIHKGGKPGQITISTVGMFGRGVDIDAENLCVLSAYIPTTEDEIQIKGRTARAGKQGEYRMIINIKDPNSPIDGRVYNLQTEVGRVQAKLALDAFSDETVAKLYGNFLESVTQEFLDNYDSKQGVDRQQCLDDWTTRLDSMSKDWDSVRPTLLRLLDTDRSSFKKSFEDFASKWQAKSDKKSTPLMPAPSQNSGTIFDAIAAYRRIGYSRNVLNAQRGYDMADDGHARIYSSLFAQEIAVLTGKRQLFANFRAWREGRGALFADLRATLSGERPLFASLRATLKDLVTSSKKPLQP